MLPPQPQFSLPTPKYVIFHGFSRPFLRRRLASSLSPSKVMYSIQSRISCGRAAAHVAGDVGLAIELLAQVEKLVRAEGVGVDDLAPVHVDALRPLVARADAVAPVIVVGEAAARPAEIRDVGFCGGPR